MESEFTQIIFGITDQTGILELLRHHEAIVKSFGVFLTLPFRVEIVIVITQFAHVDFGSDAVGDG